MIIEFEGFFFDLSIEKNEEHRLTFQLRVENDINAEILWQCSLDGLWEDDSLRETPNLRRVWDMHQIGDFYQNTLIRHNFTLRPHYSYTALFHRMIIFEKSQGRLGFIRNIYSTSLLNWLSLGFMINDTAIKVWGQQFNNGFATWEYENQRFRLLVDRPAQE